MMRRLGKKAESTLRRRMMNPADISANLKAFDDSIREKHSVRLIGGADEAGRGALAGPVIAGVVVLSDEARLAGVNDSKQLDPCRRAEMVPTILESASAWGLGMASPEEIDRINILQATHLAVRRALSRIESSMEYLITDHLKLISPPAPMLSIAKGDSTSLAVAASSVLAKVARDRWMTLLDSEYPQYQFTKHKGYGTEKHLKLLQEHGPSRAHRLSFRGVCWFDAGPTVMARSAEVSCSTPPNFCDDPGLLLDENWESLDPRLFLSRSEFRINSVEGAGKTES